jgi:hypothetical protein
MLIKKLDQNRLTEWKCVEGDEEWIDTHIIFKNHPDGMATRLVFEHTNWKKKTPLFKECTAHWLKYLESLKSYCETGTGSSTSA